MNATGCCYLCLNCISSHMSRSGAQHVSRPSAEDPGARRWYSREGHNHSSSLDRSLEIRKGSNGAAGVLCTTTTSAWVVTLTRPWCESTNFKAFVGFCANRLGSELFTLLFAVTFSMGKFDIYARPSYIYRKFPRNVSYLHINLFPMILVLNNNKNLWGVHNYL